MNNLNHIPKRNQWRESAVGYLQQPPRCGQMNALVIMVDGRHCRTTLCCVSIKKPFQSAAGRPQSPGDAPLDTDGREFG